MHDTSRSALRNHHEAEAHLPAVKDPPRPYARLSRSHEDAGRPCGDQRAAREGPQAPFGLKPAQAQVDRIVRATDFERVLRSPVRSRSSHFAVHYLPRRPSSAPRPSATELSTGCAPNGDEAVDDFQARVWLGTVIPKRHARRAVTRSLLKRQMRAAVERHAARLPGGMWVLRLRAPFERTAFRSAASDALRCAARTELDDVLASAQR